VRRIDSDSDRCYVRRRRKRDLKRSRDTRTRFRRRCDVNYIGYCTIIEFIEKQRNRCNVIGSEGENVIRPTTSNRIIFPKLTPHFLNCYYVHACVHACVYVCVCKSARVCVRLCGKQLFYAKPANGPNERHTMWTCVLHFSIVLRSYLHLCIDSGRSEQFIGFDNDAFFSFFILSVNSFSRRRVFRWRLGIYVTFE